MDRPLLLPDQPTRRSALHPLLQHLHGTYATTTPPVKLATYADDGNTLCSGPKIGPLCIQLNSYLDTLDTWFSSMNLQISASKSMATIFTTFYSEVGKDLPIYIKGNTVTY